MKTYCFRFLLACLVLWSNVSVAGPNLAGIYAVRSSSLTSVNPSGRNLVSIQEMAPGQYRVSTIHISPFPSLNFATSQLQDALGVTLGRYEFSFLSYESDNDVRLYRSWNEGSAVRVCSALLTRNRESLKVSDGTNPEEFRQAHDARDAGNTTSEILNYVFSYDNPLYRDYRVKFTPHPNGMGFSLVVPAIEEGPRGSVTSETITDDQWITRYYPLEVEFVPIEKFIEEEQELIRSRFKKWVNAASLLVEWNSEVGRFELTATDEETYNVVDRIIPFVESLETRILNQLPIYLFRTANSGDS